MADTETEPVPVPHWALDCAYYRGQGTCTGGGCWQEPRCVTDEPAGGWTRSYTVPVTTVDDAQQVFREAAQAWADELGAEEPAFDTEEFPGPDRDAVLAALKAPAGDPAAAGVVVNAASAYTRVLVGQLISDEGDDGPLIGVADRLDQAIRLLAAAGTLPEALRWFLPEADGDEG